MVWHELGLAYVSLRRWDDAIEALERAMDIGRSKGHEEITMIHLLRGRAVAKLYGGDPRGAARDMQRYFQILKTDPDRWPATEHVLGHTFGSTALRETGRLHEARAHLARAHEYAKALPSDGAAQHRAELEFETAQLKWALGPEHHADALNHAREALGHLQAMPHPEGSPQASSQSGPWFGRIRDWLAQRERTTSSARPASPSDAADSRSSR